MQIQCVVRHIRLTLLVDVLFSPRVIRKLLKLMWLKGRISGSMRMIFS